MPDSRQSRDEFLEFDDDAPAPGVEQLDEQVQKAQERLLQLKRQQELIEKEKQKLEELSRKQEQFDTGRREMVESFSAALVHIQRETDESLKRIEILKNTRQAFTSHLDELEAIDPKEWTTGDMNKELSRALGAIEDARSVYVKAQAYLAPLTDDAGPTPFDNDSLTGPGGGHSFTYWLMAGFAFTLPLFALGLLGLLLWFLQLSTP